MLHGDATFKTNTLNYQLLTLCVTDAAHRQHTIAHFVMSHKNTVQYENVLNSLKQAYVMLFPNEVFSPKYAMMDAEPAFHNAMYTCFNEIEVIMCFFHVMYNCKKRNGDKDMKVAVKKWVSKLHMTRNEEEFHLVLQNFTAAFSTKIVNYVDFIRYFKKEWVHHDVENRNCFFFRYYLFDYF